MLKRKLADSRGITIIHAMISVLIFAMVGGAIYASSMSNLKSHQEEKAYQQAYLAVSSAANTFVTSIAGDDVTYVVTYNPDLNTGEFIPSSNLLWTYNDTSLKNPLVTSTKASFLSALKEAHAHETTANYKVYRNYQIYLKQENDNVKLDGIDIYVDVCFNGYNVYANFSIKGADESSNYRMCVKIPATKEKIAEQEIGTTVTQTYQITFADIDNCTFNKGAYEW